MKKALKYFGIFMLFTFIVGVVGGNQEEAQDNSVSFEELSYQQKIDRLGTSQVLSYLNAQAKSSCAYPSTYKRAFGGFSHNYATAFMWFECDNAFGVTSEYVASCTFNLINDNGEWRYEVSNFKITE